MNDRPVDLATIFTPITGDGLVQQIVRRFTQAISMGLLQGEERLPSEAALSEWLRVSTVTLRDALAILRNAGYVETRRGRSGGTFVVSTLPTRQFARNIGAFDLEYVSDLIDYRRALATESAALAAELASEEQIQELERRVGGMAEASDYLDHMRLDAEFHIELAAASGSERMWREQVAVEMEANGVVLTSRRQVAAGRLLELGRGYSGIVAALKARDPDRARSEVSAHMALSADALMALLFGEEGTDDSPATA